jgi:hypothetical protein
MEKSNNIATATYQSKRMHHDDLSLDRAGGGARRAEGAGVCECVLSVGWVGSKCVCVLMRDVVVMLDCLSPMR